MPGPIKPPSKRINRITKSVGIVSVAGKAPRMPRGLCEQAQDAWRRFWTDVLSGVMQPADTVIAIRWAKNLDRYLRLIAQADQQPIVVGSAGQPCANPIYNYTIKLEQSIRADEAQIGVGPHNRLKLGVAFSESMKTLAEINTEANDGAETDPRAAIIALAGRRPDTPVEPLVD